MKQYAAARAKVVLIVAAEISARGEKSFYKGLNSPRCVYIYRYAAAVRESLFSPCLSAVPLQFLLPLSQLLAFLSSEPPATTVSVKDPSTLPAEVQSSRQQQRFEQHCARSDSLLLETVPPSICTRKTSFTLPRISFSAFQSVILFP